MFKVIVSGSLLAFLMLTGCSQKEPEVDLSKDKQAVSVKDETPAAPLKEVDSMSGVNVESAEELMKRKIAELEAKVGNSVYFDFDKFVIKDDMKPVLDTVADTIKTENLGAINIRVEGNCDEWGTDEYNYALGLKRAKAIQDYLVAKGVSADKLVIFSYGESNPVCKEANKDCWAKNRRGDFKLLP